MITLTLIYAICMIIVCVIGLIFSLLGLAVRVALALSLIFLGLRLLFPRRFL